MFGASDLNFVAPIPTARPTGASNAMGAYMQTTGGTSNGVSGSSVGGVGGAADAGGGSGFGFNLGTLDVALGGLKTIGSLWNAFQAQKLAKEQFKFQKEFAQKNLANQVKSYNTTLADRGRSRAAVEGQSAEQAAAYIRDNSLTA